MPDEQLERLWRDAANWTHIGLYRCADDPRWWVRKRDGGGWTINTAQRGAVLSLVAMTVVPLIPVVMTVLPGQRPSQTFVLWSVGITLVIVFGVVTWASIRDR